MGSGLCLAESIALLARERKGERYRIREDTGEGRELFFAIP